MLTNSTPKVNQKDGPFVPSASAADWCHLQHVKTLMGLSRRRLGKDDVLRLIDTREIGWAWDIAREGARRPEVRIWRESLVAYLAREGGGENLLTEELSLSQVIEAILPKPVAISMRTATVRSGELRKRFLCCQTHIAALIDDGELICIDPTESRETPAILYQSAFEFLRRRSLSI